MSRLTESSESTFIKRDAPPSHQIRDEIEYKLAGLLREQRRGLTYYQQAQSLIRAMPEYGLEIVKL